VLKRALKGNELRRFVEKLADEMEKVHLRMEAEAISATHGVNM